MNHGKLVDWSCHSSPSDMPDMEPVLVPESKAVAADWTPQERLACRAEAVRVVSGAPKPAAVSLAEVAAPTMGETSIVAGEQKCYLGQHTDGARCGSQSGSAQGARSGDLNRWLARCAAPALQYELRRASWRLRCDDGGHLPPGGGGRHLEVWCSWVLAARPVKFTACQQENPVQDTHGCRNAARGRSRQYYHPRKTS